MEVKKKKSVEVADAGQEKQEFFATDTIKDAIKTSIKQLGQELPNDKKLEVAKVLLKSATQTLEPKDVLNISEKDIARLYSFGYSLYNQGLYKDACEIFKVLLMIDYSEAEFMFCLASCYHRLKDYNTAAGLYIAYHQFENNDPLALFYAYDCFMNLNAREAAAGSLAVVVKMTENKDEYKSLYNKAKMLLDKLEKELVSEEMTGIKENPES